MMVEDPLDPHWGTHPCSALIVSAPLPQHTPGESTSKANAFTKSSLESRACTQFAGLWRQRKEEKLKMVTWCSRTAGFSRVSFASRRPRRPWEAVLTPPAIRPRLSFAPCTRVHDGRGENGMTRGSQVPALGSPSGRFCLSSFCLLRHMKLGRILSTWQWGN